MLSNRGEKWRTLSSYLYDYIFENNLEWPCMSCKWGPIVDKTDDYIKQKVYFSCRTDGTYSENENLWKKFAGFLVVAIIDIPNHEVVFDQELNHIFLQQNFKKCPFLTVKQILVHPGEINVVKKSYQDPKWVATHTDSSTVYVWNLDKHTNVPNKKENLTADIPELRLMGHTDIAPYALDWAKTQNRIASGGKDSKVLIWDIEDYQSSVPSNLLLFNKRELNAIHNTEKYTNIKLYPKREFKGHTACIEDVSFHPKDREVLMSAGDDKKLICWDTRSETPSFEILNLHEDDIHCVNWNVNNENYILTGGADGKVNIVDLRTRKELLTIKHSTKTGGVRCGQFSPFDENVFAAGGEHLFIYNIQHCIQNNSDKPLFTHGGHVNGITDFDWNPYNPWSMLSASDDCHEHSSGGGSLQTFRPLDVLCLPEEEALQKLQRYV